LSHATCSRHDTRRGQRRQDSISPASASSPPSRRLCAIWSRVFILGSACLAVTLGGCSLSPTSSSNTAGYTGTKALVASTLNLLASDANSSNGLDICEHVLASALRSTLNKSGSCQTSIDNQLKTIDDFTLTVESIKLAGSSASARVQTEYNGSKVISTVTLAHEKAGWRINSISAL
jgi:hypothetical protein